MTNSEFPKPAKRAGANLPVFSFKTSAWLIFAFWVSIAGAHFKAYGLGWRPADVHGFNEVSHTGTIDGMYSYVVMIPELELGVVLLTNGSSSAARSSVTNTIVRSFIPIEQVDWISMMKLDGGDFDFEDMKLAKVE